MSVISQKVDDSYYLILFIVKSNYGEKQIELQVTAVSSHCRVFGSRKLWFHEETLSSAERTRPAPIGNVVKRPNVSSNGRTTQQTMK